MSEEAKREFGRQLFGQPPEAEPVPARPEDGSPSVTEGDGTEGEPTKRGETVEERFNESTLAALRGPAHKTEADLRFFGRLHGAQESEREQETEEAEGGRP